MAGLLVTGEELILPLSDRGERLMVVSTLQLVEPL